MGQEGFLSCRSAVPFFIIGAVQPIRVLKFLYVQSEHNHGVDKTDFVILREFKRGERLLGFTVEKEKFAGGRPVRLNRKIYPSGNNCRPEEAEKAGTYLKAGDRIKRLQLLPRNKYKVGCVQ